MDKKNPQARSKIEIVRVSASERGNFRSADGVQVRASYNHVRVGTYCPEPDVKVVVCDSKPPIEQSRKFKKNLGPVSRLLRRRHHATYLATKSCDNIYSVNRGGSLDWRVSQAVNEQGFQSRQSSSLDWRVGRSIHLSSNKLHWRDTTRSAEQLSRSAISSDHLQTPSTKSKLVALLKRLSPRLSRPGSKASLQSSPTICPWVQVEYSSESINDGTREESQESDVSFQRELQLNELRKRMAGIPTGSQKCFFTCHVTGKHNRDGKEQQSLPQTRIQVQETEKCYSNVYKPVHEPRADEHRGEVAGLEDRLVPRTRPLSLAVQPLVYRRLDQDRRNHSMTSQESIGSCSLDVEHSASERSENTVDSISKKTLHSLNLSCNGDSPENLANGSSETLQKSHLTPDELNVSNGHRSPEPEQLTVKKPSYLGLACSVSGYSGINRYDSKFREGFRSKDSSPGPRLITRDTSPAGFRSNENLNVPSHQYPPKSQSISPLAMDRQNGFSNGLKEECKVEAYRESRSSISICQGYSEVDKGVLHAPFPDMSPIRPTTPKRSPGMSQMMSCSQQNKSFSSHFSGSSPKQASGNLSNSSFGDTSILNGSSVDVDSQILNSSSSSEKSFIQQRVERLYGPGALAQGFFFKRSTTKMNTSDSSFNKSSNNNDVSTDNANTEESLKNLPVLRHLRPEFRAQLPVVSPRRPTDGSEQVIKPLQRVTPVSRKKEQKPKIPTATKLDGSLAESSAQKLNASVTSIPDQQPAAPKVVLPVLEPSASATNIAKQAQEAEKAEEKDGHYFMKLLKQETDRLLSLAASAEAELASGDTVALPEEAAGKLRSAAGKARLLASQKMQQFEGLCQKNIIQVPGEEFPTTNEDLAGFWDMVMLQVVQVNELFEQIDKLKKSQWQEVRPDPGPKSLNLQAKSKETSSTNPFHIPLRNGTNDKIENDSKFYEKELKYTKAYHVLRDNAFVVGRQDFCEDAAENLKNSQSLNNLFTDDSSSNFGVANDGFSIDYCTPYVVNYVDQLHPNVHPFYFERLQDPSDLFAPRNLFDDIDSVHRLKKETSNFQLGTARDHSHDKESAPDFQDKDSRTKNSQPIVNENIPKTPKERIKKISFADTILPDKNVSVPKSKKFELKDKESRSPVRKKSRELNTPFHSKAKSCSPVRSNFKEEIQVTIQHRTRSHSPEVRPAKNIINTPNKSCLSRQVSFRQNDQGEFHPPSPLKSNLQSDIKNQVIKKPRYNVTFSNDVKEAPVKPIISNIDKEEGLSLKKSTLNNSPKYSSTIKSSESPLITSVNEKPVPDVPVNKINSVDNKNIVSKSSPSEEAKEIIVEYKSSTEKFSPVKNPKNYGSRTKMASTQNRNRNKIESTRRKLSVVTDVWSNLGFDSDKRNSHSRSNILVENCSFGHTSTKKKRQSKSPVKNKELEQKNSSDNLDTVFWSQSDSKPFIPMSQETLRQLRLMYNAENQANLTAVLSRSEKVERMKVYDQKRKKNVRHVEEKCPKNLVSHSAMSIHSQENLFDPPIDLDLKETNSLKNQDFSMKCLITPSNYTGCLTNVDQETAFVLNNIEDWSEQDMEIDNFLSPLINSLFSKIISEENTQQDDHPSLTKLHSDRNSNFAFDQRNFRKELRQKSPVVSLYTISDEIPKSLECLNIDTGVAVKISKPMRSDYPVRKNERCIKSIITFDQYLPLKRKNNVASYVEELKFLQLFPEDFQIATKIPSESSTIPIKIRQTVPEKSVSTSNGNAKRRNLVPKPKSANSEANKKAREAREQARRQLIEERRRAMRASAKTEDVKIFAPDT